MVSLAGLVAAPLLGIGWAFRQSAFGWAAAQLAIGVLLVADGTLVVLTGREGMGFVWKSLAPSVGIVGWLWCLGWCALNLLPAALVILGFWRRHN
jgi:hypothetical protein